MIKSFRINDFLTLKLEGGKTNLYLNGILFAQCKNLILNVINQNDLTERPHQVVGISHSERAIEHATNFGGAIYNLDPEVEYWGHCSTLQAWVENQYDGSLLHSNISFPLLKALVDAGDLDAVKAFKEEIADRIRSGYDQVIQYLLKEGYLGYLTTEELASMLDEKTCSKLLSAVKEMVDEDTKINAFFNLLKALKHTDLISKFYSQIKHLFSKFLSEVESRKEINSDSVFKQVSTLDSSYVPDEIIGMDDALKTLIFFYRRILEEEPQPSINCLLLGRGGVGKTILARFFGKNFKIIAQEKDVNLYIEYFNCINFRSKSKIFRELLAKYTHGSGRGFSDVEAIKLILMKLIREQGYIFLILDEVHLLKPEEVLEFLNIAETFGHQNAKLSILLVSRTNDWMKIENAKILSRINQKIILKSYNFDDCQQIIKYRSELAFRENVLSEELIAMIAQIATNNKNIRHGLEILRKCGLYADKEGLDRITADMIRDASNEIYSTFRLDIIDQLNDQELLVLYGITRSLINADEPFILIDEAYEEYEAICETYSIEPHVKMSFRRYVRKLNELKIVNSRRVRIEEAKGGTHIEITILDITPSKLEEILLNIFNKKFL